MVLEVQHERFNLNLLERCRISISNDEDSFLSGMMLDLRRNRSWDVRGDGRLVDPDLEGKKQEIVNLTFRGRGGLESVNLF